MREYTFEYKAFYQSNEQVDRGAIKLKAPNTDQAYENARELLDERYYSPRECPVIAIRLIGIQEELI